MSNSSVEISDLGKETIEVYKHLHTCIFPTTYPRQFYKEALEIEGVFKIAHLNGQPVGVLSTRILDDKQESVRSLYISSLGCRVQARRRGIGSLLLDHAIAFAVSKQLTLVSLHVQLGNEAAIDFYRAKGFEIERTVPRYYFRLQPSDAYLMQRKL